MSSRKLISTTKTSYRSSKQSQVNTDDHKPSSRGHRSSSSSSSERTLSPYIHQRHDNSDEEDDDLDDALDALSISKKPRGHKIVSVKQKKSVLVVPETHRNTKKPSSNLVKKPNVVKSTHARGSTKIKPASSSAVSVISRGKGKSTHSRNKDEDEEDANVEVLAEEERSEDSTPNSSDNDFIESDEEGEDEWEQIKRSDPWASRAFSRR
jgi:hypothetical protein